MTPIQQILAYAGFPTNTLVIDFETAFDADYTLKKLSAPEYINDDRFEVLGIAFKQDHHPACFSFGAVRPASDWNDVTVIGHNLNFDAMVLAMRYDIHPPFMLDTLSMFRMVYPRHSGKLKDVATTLGLSAPKGDTSQFKGLSLRSINAEQQQALGDYAINDAELEYEALLRLLPEIDRPEIELPLIHHTTTLTTQPCLRWDAEGAAELRDKMSHEAEVALDKVAWIHKLEGVA